MSKKRIKKDYDNKKCVTSFPLIKNNSIEKNKVEMRI